MDGTLGVNQEQLDGWTVRHFWRCERFPGGQIWTERKEFIVLSGSGCLSGSQVKMASWWRGVQFWQRSMERYELEGKFQEFSSNRRM